MKYTVSSEWEFIHHCVLARPAVCEVHVRCQVEALSEIRINPTVANIRQGNFHSTRVIRLHNESLSALNSLQSNITLQQLDRNCEPIVTKRHGIAVDQASLPNNQRFNATIIEETFCRYGYFLLRMRR